MIQALTFLTLFSLAGQSAALADDSVYHCHTAHWRDDESVIFVRNATHLELRLKGNPLQTRQLEITIHEEGFPGAEIARISLPKEVGILGSIESKKLGFKMSVSSHPVTEVSTGKNHLAAMARGLGYHDTLLLCDESLGEVFTYQ